MKKNILNGFILNISEEELFNSYLLNNSFLFLHYFNIDKNIQEYKDIHLYIKKRLDKNNKYFIANKKYCVYLNNKVSQDFDKIFIKNEILPYYKNNIIKLFLFENFEKIIFNLKNKNLINIENITLKDGEIYFKISNNLFLKIDINIYQLEENKIYIQYKLIEKHLKNNEFLNNKNDNTKIPFIKLEKLYAINKNNIDKWLNISLNNFVSSNFNSKIYFYQILNLILKSFFEEYELNYKEEEFYSNKEITFDFLKDTDIFNKNITYNNFYIDKNIKNISEVCKFINSNISNPYKLLKENLSTLKPFYTFINNEKNDLYKSLKNYNNEQLLNNKQDLYIFQNILEDNIKIEKKGNSKTPNLIEIIKKELYLKDQLIKKSLFIPYKSNLNNYYFYSIKVIKHKNKSHQFYIIKYCLNNNIIKIIDYYMLENLEIIFEKENLNYSDKIKNLFNLKLIKEKKVKNYLLNDNFFLLDNNNIILKLPFEKYIIKSINTLPLYIKKLYLNIEIFFNNNKYSFDLIIKNYKYIKHTNFQIEKNINNNLKDNKCYIVFKEEINNLNIKTKPIKYPNIEKNEKNIIKFVIDNFYSSKSSELGGLTYNKYYFYKNKLIIGNDFNYLVISKNSPQSKITNGNKIYKLYPLIKNNNNLENLYFNTLTNNIIKNKDNSKSSIFEKLTSLLYS